MSRYPYKGNDQYPYKGVHHYPYMGIPTLEKQIIKSEMESEKNFENNAELFFDVTNLFNNSIPINLKKENYVNFNINDKNNSVDIIIISKKVINGERVTQKANSQRLDNKNFNLLLKNLGWNYSKVDSIRNMLQRIKCNTIRTVDYKYFDIEIYNSSNLSYSYLHLKHSIEYHNIKTISNNSKYGNLFSIL